MKTKSNKIEDIITYINNELKNKYPYNEIKAFVNILFKEYTGMNSAHLLAFGRDTINESSLLNIVLATEKLKKYVPVQYILGHTEFCGLDIKLTPDVLIPRPETEELTQMIIEENKAEKLNILDLCSGSGCIALSLCRFIKNSNVFAVDISEKALQTAEENNCRLGLNVRFACMDLLTDENLDLLFADNELMTENSVNGSSKTNLKFDIIVSNPPYVMDKEKVMMSENVLNYEPPLALFVKDENPLIFYEKIAVIAEKYLKSGGKIYLEVNENLANETVALFSQKEYFAEIRKDIYAKNRFIFLQKKI